jgi:hypothetical protein
MGASIGYVPFNETSGYPLNTWHGHAVSQHSVSGRIAHLCAVGTVSRPVVGESLKAFALAGRETADSPSMTNAVALGGPQRATNRNKRRAASGPILAGIKTFTAKRVCD